MLFNLLETNKVIFLCLFFFSLTIVFKNILMIPLLIRSTRLLLALAIITVTSAVNEQRELPPHSPDKRYMLGYFCCQ